MLSVEIFFSKKIWEKFSGHGRIGLPEIRQLSRSWRLRHLGVNPRFVHRTASHQIPHGDASAKIEVLSVSVG